MRLVLPMCALALRRMACCCAERGAALSSACLRVRGTTSRRCHTGRMQMDASCASECACAPACPRNLAVRVLWMSSATRTKQGPADIVLGLSSALLVRSEPDLLGADPLSHSLGHRYPEAGASRST